MSASACPNDVETGLWTYMDEDKKSDLTMTVKCKGACYIYIYICNIIISISPLYAKGMGHFTYILGETNDVLNIAPTTPRSNNVNKKGKHISRIRISCSRSIKFLCD